MLYARRSVTEETIVKAEVAVEAVEGNNGNRGCALPHDRLMEILPGGGDPGRYHHLRRWGYDLDGDRKTGPTASFTASNSSAAPSGTSVIRLTPMVHRKPAANPGSIS